MTRYHTQQIDPVPIKRGRGRPVTLSHAILRDGDVVAVFKMQGTARAVCAAMNAAQCAGHEAGSLAVGLKAGDRIKDNDPRMHRRVLTIVREEGEYVWALSVTGREFRVLKRRIYTDGKRRTRGFSLERGSA